MKICVGLSSKERLDRYVKAGADEFYCGVFDEDWINRYGYLVGVNRRPFPDANLKNFDELYEVVAKAHSSDCKVFYTLNEHEYTNEQIHLLENHIEQANRCNVDAIIFSDPGLNYKFKDHCPVHISTGGTIFNCSSIDFYKKELNALRIILPREVSIEEIKKLTQSNPSMEYEVFIMNEGCINIDGFCNHLHGIKYLSEKMDVTETNQFATGCQLEYEVVEIVSKSNQIDAMGHYEDRLNHLVHKRGNCGICAIYYLQHLGITSLKLVARTTDEMKVIHDIKQIKQAISLAKECNQFSEYYHSLNPLFCKRDQGLRQCECYYPDILKELINE